MNWDELHTLCSLCGTSGREHTVRAYILNALSDAGIPEGDIRTDRLGNVIVHKKGKKPAGRKLLFTAHMDEVALMVTAVNSDGTLKFDTVGGVNASAVIGRQVLVGDRLLPGVIGAKPVHLLSKDARKKPAEFSELCCDIGAADKDAANALGVRPGDVIYFSTEPQTLGDGSYAAKAIDDRFGCEILLSLLRAELPYDTDFAFLVQEEVGLRGALAAANAVSPEIAVIFEATTAADLPDSGDADACCRLGKGAVISFMDRHTIYNKEMVKLAMDTAAETGVKAQYKRAVAGGNDAGAIHKSRGGVRTLAISLPCRYLHAPSCTANKDDCESVLQLARAMAEKLAGGQL